MGQLTDTSVNTAESNAINTWWRATDRKRGKRAKDGGRESEGCILTSSISLSSGSPFSHRLRCTHDITLEYSFPLLGNIRLSSSITSSCSSDCDGREGRGRRADEELMSFTQFVHITSVRKPKL